MKRSLKLFCLILFSAAFLIGCSSGGETDTADENITESVSEDETSENTDNAAETEAETTMETEVVEDGRYAAEVDDTIDVTNNDPITVYSYDYEAAEGEGTALSVESWYVLYFDDNGYVNCRDEYRLYLNEGSASAVASTYRSYSLYADNITYAHWDYADENTFNYSDYDEYLSEKTKKELVEGYQSNTYEGTQYIVYDGVVTP